MSSPSPLSDRHCTGRGTDRRKSCSCIHLKCLARDFTRMHKYHVGRMGETRNRAFSHLKSSCVTPKTQYKNSQTFMCGCKNRLLCCIDGARPARLPGSAAHAAARARARTRIPQPATRCEYSLRQRLSTHKLLAGQNRASDTRHAGSQKCRHDTILKLPRASHAECRGACLLAANACLSSRVCPSTARFSRPQPP